MIPLPKLLPRDVDLSPADIVPRLPDVSDLFQLCLSLQSAKPLGKVAEVRDQERLADEASRDEQSPTTITPVDEDSPR